MGRAPCCSENGDLKKGPWTPEEDQLLADYIQKHGHDSWRALPKLAGLNRCGKSCRLRWINYLRPDIKRGKFSEDEENLIISLHSALGNKWSRIASQLPGRTDNEIKNFWNTRIRKKLLKAGIDPKTHTPVPNLSFLVNVISQLTSSSSNIPFKVPTLMSPWINRYPSNATSDQLTNINDQLLHNILQLLNTTPLPNALKSAFFDSQCSFNQHDGQLLLDEMINQFAMTPSEDWLQNLNKISMEPHSQDQCNSIGGSFMESFGDGTGAADTFSTDDKSLISDNFFIENQLPSLLPIDEPMDNKVISIKNSPEFNVVRAGLEDYYDSLMKI